MDMVVFFAESLSASAELHAGLQPASPTGRAKRALLPRPLTGLRSVDHLGPLLTTFSANIAPRVLKRLSAFSTPLELAVAGALSWSLGLLFPFKTD